MEESITIEKVAVSISDLAASADTVWVLIAAALVMFMQSGFAMVEAGFTRTKNTANILMKNIMDFSFGSLFFWIIGFSIMFGAGNGGFMGSIFLIWERT